MTIAYLREQLCLLQRAGQLDVEPTNPMWPGNAISDVIPRVSSIVNLTGCTRSIYIVADASCYYLKSQQLGMLDRWSKTYVTPPQHPSCMTINSAKSPLTPVAEKTAGWEDTTRNDKRALEGQGVGSRIVGQLHLSW